MYPQTWFQALMHGNHSVDRSTQFLDLNLLLVKLLYRESMPVLRQISLQIIKTQGTPTTKAKLELGLLQIVIYGQFYSTLLQTNN